MQVRYLVVSLLIACGGETKGPGSELDAPVASSGVTGFEVYEQRPTELALHWQPGSDESGHYYLAYTKGTAPPDSCAPGPHLLDLVGKTSAIVSGLDPQAAYTFRLCPVDERSGSLTIAAGVTATGTTLALPPGEPHNLQMIQPSVADATFSVTWEAAAGATAYVVAYAEGTQAPATCFDGTVQHTTTLGVQLTGLPTNKTYAVRVCAKNDNPMPDLSAGVTTVDFMHSPLAPDPSSASSTAIDAEWARLAWTATGGPFKLAIGTSATPAVNCASATEGTTRTSLVLTALQPATAYTVRICTSNGDSLPLYSAGRLISFTTPAIVLPRVNALNCTTDGNLNWTGTGPTTAYAYTRILDTSGTDAPACTTSTPSLLGFIQTTSTGFASAIPGGTTGAVYWVRICYRAPSGAIDQGQRINVIMPRIVGSAYLPGSCTPAENLAAPYLTMIASGAALETIALHGTCAVNGSIIRLGGDVATTAATCTNGTWSATPVVSTLGDGPIRIAATAWDDTRYESRAAFLEVNRQCIPTGTTCGDGVVDPGEECDLGCGNGDTHACTSMCKLARCGDGLIGPGEQCDLGLSNDDHGSCMTTCQNQVCGNGVIGPSEQCDNGAANSASAACTPACTNQVCGDGYLGAAEQCDHGAANFSATGSCTPECKPQVCGDGYLGAGEECDAGSHNALDGYCLPGCHLARCGDGHQSPLEGCDDGNQLNGDACPADCDVQLPTGRLSVGELAHACGLTAGGTIVCGGYSEYYAGAPGGTFTLVTAGSNFTCGLKSDGTAACWGQPTTPPAPTGTFVQLDAGYDNVCGVQPGGAITCFGSNGSGQSTPPSGTFTQVSVGTYGACGVRSSGAISCWGSAINPPANAGTFSRVSVASSTPCGLRTNGSFACWTSAGIYLDRPGPYHDVRQGSGHTCALTTQGQVDCFGSNSVGQSTPPAATWVEIDAERNASCGIRIDGTIACWGDNHIPSTIPGAFLP